MNFLMFPISDQPLFMRFIWESKDFCFFKSAVMYVLKLVYIKEYDSCGHAWIFWVLSLSLENCRAGKRGKETAKSFSVCACVCVYVQWLAAWQNYFICLIWATGAAAAAVTGCQRKISHFLQNSKVFSLSFCLCLLLPFFLTSGVRIHSKNLPPFRDSNTAQKMGDRVTTFGSKSLRVVLTL